MTRNADPFNGIHTLNWFYAEGAMAALFPDGDVLNGSTAIELCKRMKLRDSATLACVQQFRAGRSHEKLRGKVVG